MPLFQTGDGSDETVLFVTLQIVVPLWFRQNLVGAIRLMTDSSNWIEGGSGSVDFATDKAVEMLNSMAFSEENPLPIHKLPIGLVGTFTDDNLEAGWLACNGQSLLRTAYPDLFAKIGTRYGAVDSTHFSLPEMRKRFVAGAYHLVTGYELGNTGGEETHLLTVAEIPSHDHEEHVQAAAGAAGTAVSQAVRSVQGSPKITSATGGGVAHENRPPYIALIYAIYTGIE